MVGHSPRRSSSPVEVSMHRMKVEALREREAFISPVVDFRLDSSGDRRVPLRSTCLCWQGEFSSGGRREESRSGFLLVDRRCLPSSMFNHDERERNLSAVFQPFVRDAHLDVRFSHRSSTSAISRSLCPSIYSLSNGLQRSTRCPWTTSTPSLWSTKRTAIGSSRRSASAKRSNCTIVRCLISWTSSMKNRPLSISIDPISWCWRSIPTWLRVNWSRATLPEWSRTVLRPCRSIRDSVKRCIDERVPMLRSTTMNWPWTICKRHRPSNRRRRRSGRCFNRRNNVSNSIGKA